MKGMAIVGGLVHLGGRRPGTRKGRLQALVVVAGFPLFLPRWPHGLLAGPVAWDCVCVCMCVCVCVRWWGGWGGVGEEEEEEGDVHHTRRSFSSFGNPRPQVQVL